MMSDMLFQDIKLLGSAEIMGLIGMKDAIDAMEQAFASFSDGSSLVPQRYISGIENLDLFFKPAYNADLGRIAVKMITQKKGKMLPVSPSILGVVLLLDMNTGAILSMMDGAYLTALRTGAASGIATKWLARSDAETAAIFGCGAQGRTQLEAICEVRPISKALLYDLDAGKAGQLKHEMEEKLKITIRVEKDLSKLKDAAVISTATNAEQALFGLNDIARGVHINAIGSYAPHMQELDPLIIKQGRLFVDSREAVLKESGDLIKPVREGKFGAEAIEAEMGDVINHRSEGRKHDDEITIFKSVGLGVQDLYIANVIYEKHAQQ
jgi:ornithine cyclodeaminase/alanine dehydrogenase-like protein (mu-crystallin family)